jgi:hypothetical protein
VRRSIATAALVIAWLCANGALWDVMQTAAWGRMFAGYAQTMSLTEALRETFDASKPCEMCQSIAKARGAAEKQMPKAEQRAADKLLLVIHSVDAPMFAHGPSDWMSNPPAGWRERTDPVPLPPPRV